MASIPDVYGALTSYVRGRLGYSCYLNREPEQLSASVRALPYVVVAGDFTSDYSFEDEYVDDGTVKMSVFATGDDLARTMGEALKALFAKAAEWPLIPIDAPQKFKEVSRRGFGLHTEDEADKDGNVVYRYDVDFRVIVEEAYP